ncbi:MAG: methyltransferase domain-containing protein [Bdellovibrionales bacterium]|nr:methyltransferase domain-containing protein [Bdellovibrionales bacterium]
MKRLWNYFLERIWARRQIERFYLVFGGHIFFETLRTAVRLGLFDCLESEPKITRQQLAQRLGLAEQPVRILLLGLTASGLIRKRGTGYRNTRVARMLLTAQSPLSVRSYIELQHRLIYRGVYWLLDSVRNSSNCGLKELSGNEPTLYQRLAHHPDLEGVFQQAMQELSNHANRELAEHLDLKSVHHLVDVGGGDATNAIALAKRWPHLQVSVFDSPSVSLIAEQNVRQQGFEAQVKITPGDCFGDPFPSSADALLFCHFFTIWGEQRDRQLLAKCYASLPKGGRVIIFNMMQRNDERGPLSAAIGSPYFLSIATGAGMLYTWKEYQQWMREAGFARTETLRLPRDHGVIIGIK